MEQCTLAKTLCIHMYRYTPFFYRWIYLEPIFSNGGLKQEKNKFTALDRTFRHILSYIENDSRVSSLSRYPNLKEVLDQLHGQLAKCQKSLEEFLSVINKITSFR